MNRVGLLVVLVLLGCQQQQNKEQILARVGDAVLTVSHARSAIDTSVLPYEKQVRQYVSTWVTQEMLYQEAVRQGMDQRDRVQQRLLEMRKQLTIQEFLQAVLYRGADSVTGNDVQRYFDDHLNEFSVREDMMKINLIGFTAREHANSFASRVTRGANWNDAVDVSRNDSLAGPAIISFATGRYYTQRTMLYPELWKVAQTLREQDVSFPVRTASGYFVIQLLASARSGSVPVFDMVYEEARLRLIRERQQVRYDSLIGTLRRHSSVELVLPVDQQYDSTQINDYD